MNNGSGYSDFGLFFRMDGQIEIGGIPRHPDEALVKVFDLIPAKDQAAAIKAIKAHKRNHPVKKRTFHV